jgi:hypothetical protein
MSVSIDVMNFKVGDKVRVRKGLPRGELYHGLWCGKFMSLMGGRVLTVKHVHKTTYDVYENCFAWNDAMLEPANNNTKDNKTIGKFKVGDKVKVREDLKYDGRYFSNDHIYWQDVTSEMVKLAGQVVTIDQVYENEYRIKECVFYWTDEMFEPTPISSTSTTVF